MPKHLYFICPTDHLEPVINQTFPLENYFITSLGNSIEFDSDRVAELYELQLTRNIRDISFVLADNNRIVLDALEKQKLIKIAGLNTFHHKIKKQKEYASVMWSTHDHRFLTISYHLNDKINALKRGLKCLPFDSPRINGLIYNRHQKTFNSIYSDLVCRAYESVN